MKSNDQPPPDYRFDLGTARLEIAEVHLEKQPQLALKVLDEARVHGLWLMEHHAQNSDYQKLLQSVDAYIAQLK